ncbi:hypothetical protein D770_04215 [Flammeovirgaceae bacterium 311]|nr:hypothetical protein D770_04215 [Flammeovirgaceae bacterium 311]
MWRIEKMISEPDYIDRDELGLFCTLIESVTVAYNPIRTIKFDIIKPINLSESPLRYSKGTLTFKDVIQGEIKLINEKFEYPEFHCSAIRTSSDILTKILQNKGVDQGSYKDYYISIDHGNSQDEYHIICQTHELLLDDSGKLLGDFEGFEE